MSKDMTLQQVDKAVGNFRAMLVKHADNFPSDAVQAVLGDSNFAAAQFRLFRERVEDRSSMIVRDFIVDLTLIGMAALKATGRVKYVNNGVLASMPHATVASGKLYFFQAGRYTPVGEEDAEYAKRGLIAIDPHTLAAFNAANPEFADTYRNCTQWKDAVGNFCCATFLAWNGKRVVSVDQSMGGWTDDWWLVGVKKPASPDK